jgi:hypothetical protein
LLEEINSCFWPKKGLLFNSKAIKITNLMNKYYLRVLTVQSFTVI